MDQSKIKLDQFKERVDTFQLTGKPGATSLAGYIENALGIDPKRFNLAPVLEQVLSDPNATKDIPALKRRLAATIRDLLGISDPENSKLIAQSVSRFVESRIPTTRCDGAAAQVGRRRV